MKRGLYLLLLVLGMLAPTISRARDRCLQDTHDVFNQLQRNAWYLPTADKAAQLYVTHLGDGPPVVFLHGGPGNDFHYIIDALRPQLDAHQFILYEQRGSLLSPVPEKAIGRLSMKLMVQDLETLRQALGVDKLVLFGHSFGTVVAMMYYQAHPDHVAGMVLAGSSPPTFKPGGLMAWVKAMRPRQSAMRNRKAMIATVEKDAGLPDDPGNDTPEQHSIRWRIADQAALDVVDLGRWKQVTGGGVYYNEEVDNAIGNTLPDDFDIRPTLKVHPVPITIINGDHDYVDPSGESWRPLTGTGQVMIKMIPHAGHYAWIDDPRAFADALRAGLAHAQPR